MTSAKTRARWKNIGIWLALTWRWFIGGPRLLRELVNITEDAKAKRVLAENSARDDRREIFKHWSLVTAATDGTVIRIRPDTATLHIQGAVTEAVYNRIKLAWKESALLIRLPFPLVPQSPGGVSGDRPRYVLTGDWKVRGYEPSAT